MTARADLPRLQEIPIPEDVEVGPTWPASMREMADYIGAYDTLRVTEALSGEQIYISRDVEQSPMRDILTPDKVATITRVYGGSRYFMPTGAKELRAARRAGVIAAVRAKRLSAADAAKICGTSRSHIAYLINQTDQGQGSQIPAAVLRLRLGDTRQLDMFDAPDDSSAGRGRAPPRG